MHEVAVLDQHLFQVITEFVLAALHPGMQFLILVEGIADILKREEVADFQGIKNDLFLFLPEGFLKQMDDVLEDITVHDGFPTMIQRIGPQARNEARAEFFRSFVDVDVSFELFDKVKNIETKISKYTVDYAKKSDTSIITLKDLIESNAQFKNTGAKRN